MREGKKKGEQEKRNHEWRSKARFLGSKKPGIFRRGGEGGPISAVRKASNFEGKGCARSREERERPQRGSRKKDINALAEENVSPLKRKKKVVGVLTAELH